MSTNSITITAATLRDLPRMRELFAETVRNVNSEHYDPEEIEDWVSCGDNARWEELFSRLVFYVAKNNEQNIVGFASIAEDGLLHSLFVDRRCLRKGIAAALLEKAQEYAHTNGIKTVTSEVSITAKPFFERMGFRVQEEQRKRAKKLYLKNYLMKKDIK